jgi:lipopolysaccharide export LptBFGC system permease protein LptF
MSFFLLLSCLLACSKVLLELQKQKELLILFLTGMSPSRVLSPFYGICFVSILLSYANAQWLIPYTYWKEEKRLSSMDTSPLPPLRSIHLPDQSILIYAATSNSANQWTDLFWILSDHRIMHINKLELNHPEPLGFQVSYFKNTVQHNNESRFTLEKQVPVETFPSLDCLKNLPTNGLPPPNCLPLIGNVKFQSPHVCLALRIHKWLSPLFILPFIAFLAPLTFQFQRAARAAPFFFITFMSFFLFATSMDAIFLIAEQNLISPFWMCLPLCIPQVMQALWNQTRPLT